MRTTIITLMTLFLLSSNLKAQSIQEEINEQVWKPFIEAYRTNDADMFNALHSEDLLRVSGHGIQGGESYRNQNERIFASMQAKNKSMQIDFTFDQRMCIDDVAYEVGVFKITMEGPNGPREFYGQFHVVLRKIDGKWKIIQDWDGSQVLGITVGPEHFNSGRKMEEFIASGE